jgi:hypothetical protein
VKTLHSIIETVGVEATTDIKQTSREADLDWEVLEAPVVLPNGDTFPRKKLLLRSDNGAPLGIVGENYTPSTPRQFLERQYELAGELGGKVVRAGFLPRSSRVFSVISFKEDLRIKSPDAKVGDVIRAFVYTTDGWDGATPIQSRLYLERLVCLNGMTSQKLHSSIWVSHTRNVSLRWDYRVEEFKRKVQEGITFLSDRLNRLAETPMTVDEARGFFDALLPGDHPHRKKVRENLLNLFQNGIGNQGRTRYDALNAITEYETHHLRFRVPPAQLEEHRFLRVLGDNPLRERAYDALLNQSTLFVPQNN